MKEHCLLKTPVGMKAVDSPEADEGRYLEAGYSPLFNASFPLS